MDNFIVDVGSIPKFNLSNAPIVVIDDDNEQNFILNRCYLKSQLSNKIIFYTNPKEFIHDFQRNLETDQTMPELLLIDINMPEIDGFAVLQAVRQSQLEKQPAVVMLSSSTMGSDVKKAHELGADAYWVKPISSLEYISFFDNI